MPSATSAKVSAATNRLAKPGLLFDSALLQPYTSTMSATAQPFSCLVCKVSPSPTIDCLYCEREFGLCDNCLGRFNAMCPFCGEGQG